jgi:hypothetical protein
VRVKKDGQIKKIHKERKKAKMKRKRVKELNIEKDGKYF